MVNEDVTFDIAIPHLKPSSRDIPPFNKLKRSCNENEIESEGETERTVRMKKNIM